jgi:hypothetical protein
MVSDWLVTSGQSLSSLRTEEPFPKSERQMRGPGETTWESSKGILLSSCPTFRATDVGRQDLGPSLNLPCTPAPAR